MPTALCMEYGCALKTVDTHADGTHPDWHTCILCCHCCWWRQRCKFWGYI